MLLQFRVKNYRSIHEEVVLSLLASTDKALASTNVMPTGLKGLGKAVPHLQRTPIEIVIGVWLLAERIDPGKRMARCPSAWPVPFEYRNSDLTAC